MCLITAGPVCGRDVAVPGAGPDPTVPPMAPDAVEQRAQDGVCRGKTTLLAALDVTRGAVIGNCYGRHRANEFLSFLKEIEAVVPEGLGAHLEMVSGATRKVEKVTTWLSSPQAQARPLDVDLGVTVQPERAPARGTGQEEVSDRLVTLGRRTQREHQALHRRIQREAEALHSGRIRRRDS